MRLLQLLTAAIDGLNERIGRALGWVTLALVALVAGDVVGRYVFRETSVAVNELESWLFAVIFLLGAGYTYLHEGHVRVDLIQHRLPRRWQVVVDLVGVGLFLLPTCFLVVWTALPFVATSWRIGETSADPGGLPASWLLKAAIPLGFSLLALQGLSHAVKLVRTLREREG